MLGIARGVESLRTAGSRQQRRLVILAAKYTRLAHGAVRRLSTVTGTARPDAVPFSRGSERDKRASVFSLRDCGALATFSARATVVIR